MEISNSRLVALILLDLIVFGISAFVLLQLMPKPLKPIDYLIIGVVSTLISLLGVWLLLLRESKDRQAMLYKKRNRKLDGEEISE
jgi:hypothetical protein